MVTGFWPKHNKCLKMGSNSQIFASLRTRITIFIDLKRIIMIKEIPRKGSFGALIKEIPRKGSFGALKLHQITSKY